MLILGLWGISFHAVVVFGLGKNLLFKSILGRCVKLLTSGLQLLVPMKKKLKQKSFFKKATNGFVTVYNGGRGRPKTIKTSEAIDIIEKSQIEAKVPEKIEVNNPENIKAKISKKKLQSKKGEENVAPKGKTIKVLGTLQN